MRSPQQGLLLGEWACLGIIYPAPTHGFAVAAHLKPAGDIGRVWSLSRALTYRAIDQLVDGGQIHAVGEEPGKAGGVRTVLAPTRSGRAQLKKWLVTPAAHLRDVRSELLLKLVLADGLEVDTRPLLLAQRERVASIAAARANDDPHDVVVLWRRESAAAVVRFLDALLER